VAPNTLDTEDLLRIRDRCEQEGKEVIKKKWGIIHNHLLIFVGRFLKDKQVDFLLKVFQEVEREIKDCGLILVGDGPERESVQLEAEKRGVENVYFLGEITDVQKTGELLYISDALVMPGYLGLAVVHSFCFDKPVVSQAQGLNGPFHSPEIEYLLDGKTGFLTPPGDVDEMARRIIALCQDEELLTEMKSHIRKTVQEKCSLNKMINGFAEAIEQVS